MFQTNNSDNKYGVAVIGGGHAGIEAALAAARMGVKTIIFTLSLDAVGNMPCNPSIGGTGKGHLVFEIDALGGEMGRTADKTMLQCRMLNASKGPAVHSLRFQSDREKYRALMKDVLENQENLDIYQAEITEIIFESVGRDDLGAPQNQTDEPPDRKTLVGFCVLGGVFSEGIDLTGDRLNGAVIVGVGLPKLSAERDIIKNYFNEKNNLGYEYSYMYPGMNKVLQAAGRVIRTETDKGIVLLLDERFNYSYYKQLFPEHWRHFKIIRTPEQLRKIIEKF